jgi:hypothetical protein
MHDLQLNMDPKEFEDYVVYMADEEKYNTRDAIQFILEDLVPRIEEV